MAFIEKQNGDLIYMTSSLIQMPHAFSTRYGGVSKGQFAALNLSSDRGDDPVAVRENYTRIAALMGAGPDDCCVTKQVHGKEVRIVTSADKHVCMSSVPYEADGLVTAEKNLPIFCFAADCIPVLLCDAENGVAAAIHCGWRSSVADILQNAVNKMVNLGANPTYIAAALGPAIGKCHFETDGDVPEEVKRYLSGDTEGLFRQRHDGKYLVDLRGANARRLLQLGIQAEKIDISEECTVCCHEKYWSHRYTKGMRGSQCAVICVG